MARKTIRRNGRNITIDTRTGKEIKPGTLAWKMAGQLYTKLKKLPRDMVSQAKFAAKDISDNVIYSDKLDKKGRPQTIAQQRVRKETADKNRTFKGPGGNPDGSGQGQAQRRVQKSAPKVGNPKPAKKKSAPKAGTAKPAEKKSAPKVEVSKKPAAPKPTEKAKSSADRMRTWALANKKMIEKSGTKTQREILAKALKTKKNKSSALAIGGYS